MDLTQYISVYTFMYTLHGMASILKRVRTLMCIHRVARFNNIFNDVL